MVEGIPSVWRKIPYRYKLEGSYCENCGTHYFPPRVVCAKCRRKGKLVNKQLSGKGKIFSYTKVFVAPTGLEIEVPYYLALIQLAEGDKVLGQLVESDDNKVTIGAPVELTFRKMMEDGEEGLIHYGYKFKVKD